MSRFPGSHKHGGQYLATAPNSTTKLVPQRSPMLVCFRTLKILKSFVPLGRLNAIAAYCTNTAPHLAGQEGGECKTRTTMAAALAHVRSTEEQSSDIDF